MNAVFKRAGEGPKRAEETSSGLRRCLSSGAMKPREAMIRFVLGPDGTVVPDLAENLPGMGLWVSATPEAIQKAVDKNLFARAGKAHVSKALVDEVIGLLRKRCLDFLGLAKGAGVVVLGETQTEAALRSQKLDLYLHAPDAARTLDFHYPLEVCDLFSRDALGAAFGFASIVYAGLVPHGLTKKLKLEIKRLKSMTGVL
ncbi:MAG: DUF448 domain-containing protein [Alphaproteobacteria bacterium]|nr:DUF448 domain-containing protein [Alphaproteobacteria bacterium]